MGTIVSREVSTKFNQYHVVPVHNSTAEDGKQNHTTGLVILRNQDSDETDLEVVEIVAGTASMSPMSGPEVREMFPDNFFDTSGKPLEIENYGPNEPTLPASNTFTAIHSDNEWLKRYIPDGHNSQIGNMQNKIEVTTEDGKKWYRIRIPYLCRFYITEVYLVEQETDCIYILKGKEKEMVCVRTTWTPYKLVALEEVLRNNQYLRLKGIRRFEEEGENIINRLVSKEERSLSKGKDFRNILNYKARQKLYERRLKMTKAIQIMLREITALKDENQDQISLYITQKPEFTAGLHMLIDQIDSVLQKDNECHKAVGFQTVKTPKFYDRYTTVGGNADGHH